MADPNPKDVVGCVHAILGFFTVLPMWLVLLYGILSRVEAPSWMWGVYFAYVPTAIATAAIGIVVKFLDE